MTTKKTLGVYFGNNSISVAEVVKKKLYHHFSFPHNLSEIAQTPLPNIPDEIKLTAILQKSLRDKKIESTDVVLSLQTKDIILRSFFIPWMTSNEVKGVVEFEINRYIPFKLQELAYNYHATTITENKTKRIRILFVAIRKDTVEKYCSVLEQINLRIIAIEAEPISLVRLLTFKKFIQPSQTTVLVHAENKEGAIIIVDNGIPQFVREFRLGIPTVTTTGLEYDTIKSRLFNEIRMSLDYYSRLHPQSIIERILFLSSMPIEVTDSLGKDLGIASVSLNACKILEIEQETPLSTLNVFGAGLRKAVPFAADIDLAKARIKETLQEVVMKPLNRERIMQVGALCAAVLFLVFILSNLRVASYKAKSSQLTKRQGAYETLSIEDINKKREEAIKKLDSLKNLNLKSNVAYFLKRIPQLLPKEAWLNTLTIIISEIASGRSTDRIGKTGQNRPRPQVTITMEGYIFTEDINEQVTLVNNLPKSFKKDPNFFIFFQDAKLIWHKDNIRDETVTFFQVSLK